MTLIKLGSYSVKEFVLKCGAKKLLIGKSSKGTPCFVCGEILGAVAENIDYKKKLKINEVEDDETGRRFFVLENSTQLTGDYKCVGEGRYIDKYGVRFCDDGETLEEFRWNFWGKYVIPNSVTKIECRAFENCMWLTFIEIPDSVIYIGNLAFCGCTGLTSIKIPSSVKKVGFSAFEGCRGLKSIEIPSNVTKVGVCAFNGCTGLTSMNVSKSNHIYDSRGNCNAIIETKTNKLVAGCKTTVIPGDITEIENSAFCHCTGLTSIEIPNSVTKIGEHVFDGCFGLTSIKIPDSVTKIDKHVFTNCTNLTSIEIPNSITEIGSAAFFGCKCLTYLKTPDCLTIIGERAFEGCKGLTSIEIHDSVTEIGYLAFGRCIGLTSIKIPDSVTKIGKYAFAGCSCLKYMTVAKNNCVYDSRGNCNAIIETETNKIIAGCQTSVLPDSVTGIENGAFEDCTGLTSIKIPNSVTEIGDDAFSGCTGLSSMNISDGVIMIGHGAFANCTGLTSMNVSKSNHIYDSRENCNAIIETKTNTLVAGCKTTVIPYGVTLIGYKAFYKCAGLTSIAIPESVTKINLEAFYECTGLSSIEIPNSISMILDYAFRGCTNLKSLIIKYASGNEELKINYLNHLDRKIIKYITISDGITSIPDAMFVDSESLEMVYLSNTLTALPDKTFHNCKSLEELNIPDSVKRIGDECIVGCGLLKTLVIPEGVEELGNRAICDCEGLESVTLPSTIKRVGTEFLSGCINLKQVIIPSGSKIKFLQLGLDNLKDKLVERGTGTHAGNFAPQGDVDELNMLFTLGRAYELGIGVGKNILQAVMMYTQAAGKGHAEAAYRIAEMYRKGEGLPQNMESAIQYYRIAANSNFMDSASIVKDYEESLRKEEQRRAEEQKRIEEQRRVEALKLEEERASAERQTQTQLQPYYLFFDTETTGLPACYDAPCSDTNNWPRLVQLSWIVTDIDGNVIRTSDNIIKPVGFTIPLEASNLHGITTNKALSEGKDLRSVIDRFMNELRNVNYVVGHNIEFDINIVGAELYRLGVNVSDLLYKHSICTMKSTIDYCQIPPYRYGSYKFPNLQELHKKLFGYEFDDAHNSMCDVEATKKCFFELVKRRII